MFVKRVLIICTVPFIFLSCALIWLGDLELTTTPAENNQIINSDDQITIGFSEEVDRISFESIFSLTGPGGDEEGDFLWDTASVVFLPAGEMQPGFRYRMKINGELKAVDGKTYTEYIDIPFYYRSDALPPLFLSSDPANAEIINTDTELILNFSKAVDSDSFEDSFSLSPSTDFSCEWTDGGARVVISPVQAWTNLKYYSWLISTELTDSEGIHLPRKETGSFLVQFDTTAPLITGIHPAADNGDGSYSILSAFGPENLLLGQHLALTFSEGIDFTSLRQNLSFDPSIEGYIAAINPATALYYISEDLPPANEFKLTIEKGLTDTRGNATIEDWTSNFTPDIPAQTIVNVIIEDSVSPDTVLDADDFNEDSFITIAGLDYYGTDSLYFYVDLSEGIPAESLNQRREFVSGISLSAVFPPGTAVPSQYSSDWITDNRIRLIYEDLVTCTAGVPVYYRFRIPAGSTDSASPEGAYLLDAISFIFLAEEN